MEKVTNNITIENAVIRFRNFSGAAGRFNPAGKRNFCVFLDNETANVLQNDGWNVKWLQPRNEEDNPQGYLQVNVSFDNYPPKIMLITSNGRTMITEETVDSLDWAEIETVDIVIRPYNWEVNGKQGVSAYLKSMYVTIVEDTLDKKYSGAGLQSVTSDDEPF